MEAAASDVSLQVATSVPCSSEPCVGDALHKDGEVEAAVSEVSSHVATSVSCSSEPSAGNALHKDEVEAAASEVSSRAITSDPCSTEFLGSTLQDDEVEAAAAREMGMRRETTKYSTHVSTAGREANNNPRDIGGRAAARSLRNRRLLVRETQGRSSDTGSTA